MASQQFVSQTVTEDLKPLRVAGREAYVFPSYRARMAQHSDENAVVTSGGKPIVENGETLLLGMVPLERRYAIGPVVGGRAEVIDQHSFEQESEKNYVAEYNAKGQAPDKTALRFIPNVVRFVSWKIDPTDPRRITHLGFSPGQKLGADIVSQSAEEIESLRAQKDEQALALDEMKRKLDELSQLMASKPAEVPGVVVAHEKAMQTAPCGKEIKQGFLKQHARFCKKPECRPEVTL